MTMDFRPEPDTAEFAGMVRELCTRHVTEDCLSELDSRFGPGTETGGTDRASARLHTGLWEALGAAGVVTALCPSDSGGDGLGVVAAALVARELGRALAPVPLESAVCAVPLLAAAGCADTARRVATGSAIAAVGDWPAVPGAGVDWAPVADVLAVPEPAGSSDGVGCDGAGDGAGGAGGAGDGDGAGGAGGAGGAAAADSELVLHVGELPTTDVEVTRLVPVDYSCAGLVDGAQHLPARRVTRAALERHMLVRRVLLAARQWGTLEAALERTAAYAGERRQFGRPIGTFQAVSGRLADALIDVDAVRLSVLRAAGALDAVEFDAVEFEPDDPDSPNTPVGPGDAARAAVAAAHFWACEAGHRVGHTAVHVHGGVGLDRGAPPHRYFLAAKAAEFRLGGATRQLLDLGGVLATACDPWEDR